MLKVIKIEHDEYLNTNKNYDYFAGFVIDPAKLKDKRLVKTTNTLARAEKYKDNLYFNVEHAGKKTMVLKDMDLMYQALWELKMQGYKCKVIEIQY